MENASGPKIETAFGPKMESVSSPGWNVYRSQYGSFWSLEEKYLGPKMKSDWIGFLSCRMEIVTDGKWDNDP